MDDKTLTALNASIAKWEKNAAAETPEQVKMGTRNCALCHLYLPENANQEIGPKDCDGCPVFAYTGRQRCESTPYSSTYFTIAAWIQFPEDKNLKDRFQAAAQREVDFLKSLLPQTTEK